MGWFRKPIQLKKRPIRFSVNVNIVNELFISEREHG